MTAAWRSGRAAHGALRSDEVVDAHVHFWDPVRFAYPWLAGVPSVAGAHGAATLRREAGDSMPGRIVFVQAECDRSRFLDEVAWVEEMAREEPAVAAIVAFAPLADREAGARALEALSRRPLVRGVRYNVQGDPDPNLCERPAFVEGVRATGQAGLCFDLCARSSELPAVARLVEACPDTRFVLDHAGKPPVRDGSLDPWRADVRAIAAFPNVMCKLSGLLTEGDRSASPETMRDALRPFVEHVVQCFGPARLVFGSDWPVVKLASTYLGWLEMARELTFGMTPEETRAVFRDNARKAYQIE